jgi:hypothetical protein
MEILSWIGYALLAYLAVAFMYLVYIVFKGVTWNGSHDDFLAYQFGVAYDMGGFMRLCLDAARWSLYWPMMLREHFMFPRS